MQSRKKDKGFVPFYKIKYNRSEMEKMDDEIFIADIKEDMKKIEAKLNVKFKTDPAARYVGHVLSIVEDARLMISKAFASCSYE